MRMKQLLLLGLAIAAMLAAARAQNQTLPPGKVPVYNYERKPVAHLPVIIDPQQAQVIVDEFRTNYSLLGSPRILVYVNRYLFKAQPDTNAAATNQTITLANRQTVRDVERLVARPLRAAGASLVDRDAVALLNSNQPPVSSSLTQSGPAHDALARVADVVVEVLISSHTVTVNEVSGNKTYTVPDITMTAHRLKDAKVIGHVSASEVISRAGGPGYVARSFGVEDVTETTALALMDNMLREAK